MLYTRREESLRMFFPALCYAIVNMCSYAGIKLLDLPTYIITWQLKILAAALFGLVLYQREVSARKWLALFILVSGELYDMLCHDKLIKSTGVTLVQLQPTEGTPSPRATQDYILGILIVILGSLGSGLAGAFLENALKSKTSPSIYIRNMQICFPALLFTAASFYFAPKDLQLIKEKGFFAGFSPIVWCMIALHGLGMPTRNAEERILMLPTGGMLVSFLVKHVGALWKGFASSLAIVGELCDWYIVTGADNALVTNLVSIYTMPGSVTSPFQVWIGSALVIGSTLLFANS